MFRHFNRSMALFPKQAADPTKMSYSPLGRKIAPFKSPYATSYPTELQEPSLDVTVRRPYERLIKMRRLMAPSRLGTRQTYDAWVVVGDQHGSAGMAHAKSNQANKALKKGLTAARRSMKHYDLYEGRTLYHDIEFKYGALQMKMFTKPAGYSIRAQRNAHDVCQAIGIQDIAIQIQQGSPNPCNIARAVFWALDNLHRTPAQISSARGKPIREI